MNKYALKYWLHYEHRDRGYDREYMEDIRENDALIMFSIAESLSERNDIDNNFKNIILKFIDDVREHGKQGRGIYECTGI